MGKRWGREWNGVLTINRKDEVELEKAIADLTARGFEVIRRGSNEHEKKHFDRRYNCLSNRAVFTDKSVYKNCWAVLKEISS